MSTFYRARTKTMAYMSMAQEVGKGALPTSKKAIFLSSQVHRQCSSFVYLFLHVLHGYERTHSNDSSAQMRPKQSKEHLCHASFEQPVPASCPFLSRSKHSFIDIIVDVHEVVECSSQVYA